MRTEFHERSGISISGAKKWMWLDAEDVVRQGLTANAQGASLCIPSAQYRALSAGLRFMPGSVVQWATDRRMSAPADFENEEPAVTETDSSTK